MNIKTLLLFGNCLSLKEIRPYSAQTRLARDYRR